ncbi:MAG: siphovirus Gp157 family protein, partial [Brevinema sp.]
YTIYCLEQMGNKKIDTNLGRLSLRKKPASLIVTDENQVPNIYKTVEQIIKIDKAQIKKDLKEKNIDGVELVEGGNGLSIK